MGGLKDVIVSSVAAVSPLLGRVLGSPLYGVGLTFIAKAFGLDVSQIDEIAKKAADPEWAAKLKEVEWEHAVMWEQIVSQNYALEVDDRKDARRVALPYKDFLRHMAYLVTIGFFGALFLLFVPVEINAEGKNLLSMLVGMLASKWQTIIDFFYGSSRPQNQGGLKS